METFSGRSDTGGRVRLVLASLGVGFLLGYLFRDSIGEMNKLSYMLGNSTSKNFNDYDKDNVSTKWTDIAERLSSTCKPIIHPKAPKIPFDVPVKAMRDTLFLSDSHRSTVCAETLSMTKQGDEELSILDESICGHRFIWVTGMHHSGTSLLNYILQEHEHVSGHISTGVPENEGQHLQGEFPNALKFGGECKFERNDKAYMDEHHKLATETTRECVYGNWAKYWNLTTPVLVEKSPSALVQLQFREWLFPGVSASIVTVRHPLYMCDVKYHRPRTSRTGVRTRSGRTKRIDRAVFSPFVVEDALAGWLKAHQHLQNILSSLDQYTVLMFEDFFMHKSATEDVLGLVSKFFPDVVPSERRRLHYKGFSREKPQIDTSQIFSWSKYWEEARVAYPGLYNNILPVLERYEDQVNAFGYSLLNISNFNSTQFDFAFGSKFSNSQVDIYLRYLR